MKVKIITAILALTCSVLYAQTVEVKDAWVRSTVAGQKGTGAFMNITSKEGTKLVSVSSPAAGVVEVHEMKMEGDIMKMRAVPSLDLPAGQVVQLRPGSYHIMMMDLKQPLPKDSTVPLTLRFKDAKGTESKVELTVPVSTLPPSANAAGGKADGMAGQHRGMQMP